jgi:hypothetical protein
MLLPIIQDSQRMEMLFEAVTIVIAEFWQGMCLPFMEFPRACLNPVENSLAIICHPVVVVDVLDIWGEKHCYTCSGINLQNERKEQELVNPFFNSL